MSLSNQVSVVSSNVLSIHFEMLEPTKRVGTYLVDMGELIDPACVKNRPLFAYWFKSKYRPILHRLNNVSMKNLPVILLVLIFATIFGFAKYKMNKEQRVKLLKSYLRPIGISVLVSLIAVAAIYILSFNQTLKVL